MNDFQPQLEAGLPAIAYGMCHCGCGYPAPVATQTSVRWGWRKGAPKKFIAGHNSAKRPKHRPRLIEVKGEQVFVIDCGGSQPGLLSKDDADLAFQHRWSLHSNGYICKSDKRKITFLHNLVASRIGIEQPDHENRCRTDNRRSNLREATRAENSQNASIRNDNKSGVKGVSYHRATGKFQVQINKDGKRIYLGLARTKQEAVRIRTEASTKFHGRFSGEVVKHEQ